ncbi:MAG: T9SS type A sorting domain-containing protein [Candidatus Marinimicrobia bacterium]|nr:T9SS type A sorting domain-containing protein [Candidatus Neomarinimicrobiota bacterium]
MKAFVRQSSREKRFEMLKSMINPDLSGKKLAIFVFILFITQISFAQTIFFESGEGYYEVEGPTHIYSNESRMWGIIGPGNYAVSVDLFWSWSVNPEPYILIELGGYGSGNGSFILEENITVTFANGSSFTPNISAGSSNQAIGRFQLTGASTGASLTGASIKLNGTRTGMSNIKLWSSANATFESGSDTQLGSTVGSDPGNGNSASFNFTSSISTSGTYYFVTVDLASGATGMVQGVIVQNSSLTISGGSLSGSISNAVLSSGDASLPVELTSFTAENQSGGVLLKWSTESEIENLGFILERRDSKLEIGNWEEIAGYLSNTALEGHGSTTEAHEYQYMDRAVQPGATYEYRLGDVDYSGKVTWHKKLEIKVEAEGAKIPTEFGLQRAYPNPFNPTTTISYQLASSSFVKISIYDVRGKLVETLVNEQKDRGNYSLVWDAGGLSSGIYLYKIAAGEYSEVNKCLLIR